MIIRSILIFLSLIFIISCGEGIITVDESNYEQKIVVEGYLYPEKRVSRIRISRNLPINVNVFLDVQATIDGKELSTSSVTKVPFRGFNVIDSLSTDSIYFYQKDNQGKVLKPRIVYQRSVDTDFYAFSIVALDASASTFIYDHPWVRGIEEQDVIENLHELRFSRDTIFNTPETPGYTILNIEYFHTLFYGWYRITCYAGDANFKDYFLTHANVMEFDGNLHEPKFHFEGDGIGVFGSAIVETRYIKILP
jgi:hypothetical protein